MPRGFSWVADTMLMFSWPPEARIGLPNAIYVFLLFFVEKHVICQEIFSCFFSHVFLKTLMGHGGTLVGHIPSL